MSCGWLNLFNRIRDCFRGAGSDRGAGAYRDLKSSNKIIRFQRSEFPPSENRGERGILCRRSFSRVQETTGAMPPHASAPLRRSSCPGRRGARTLVAMDTPRYWYTAKQWPFGHRLAQTWEGWLVDFVWVATSLGISTLLRKDSQHPVLGLGIMFGLMAVFIALRSWKGEPKRWEG